MTSKERVHAALSRKPVDRVPIFMWFHPDTTRRLASLLEIPLAFVGEAMGVDTVDLLPHGTVSEVRRSTARLLQGMTADGGGYIHAASHTIPPETPNENIFALFMEAGVSKDEIGSWHTRRMSV